MAKKLVVADNRKTCHSRTRSLAKCHSDKVCRRISTGKFTYKKACGLKKKKS